jgi:hypothetical protein
MQQKEKKVDRTILAITDFSRSSTNAVLFAIGLFKYSTLKIILLHTFGNPSERENSLIFIEDVLAKKSEESLKKQTEKITSILRDREVNITTYSLAGRLKKGIAKIIESEDADIIVAGIPAGKYPPYYLNDYPVLFTGQSKHPVLLVPENCVDRPLRNVLTINCDPAKQQNSLNTDLEHIVNHGHIVKYTVNLHEKKIDRKVKDLLHTMLKKEEVELIIFIPAPADKIDKALLDYQIQELPTAFSSLLSY